MRKWIGLQVGIGLEENWKVSEKLVILEFFLIGDQYRVPFFGGLEAWRLGGLEAWNLWKRLKSNELLNVSKKFNCLLHFLIFKFSLIYHRLLVESHTDIVGETQKNIS